MVKWATLFGKSNERARHRWAEEATRLLPAHSSDLPSSALPAKEVTKVALRLKYQIEQVIPIEIEATQITKANSPVITPKVVKTAKEAGGEEYKSCVVYCLLVCKRWFEKQAILELWDSDLHDVRAVACQVIAKRIIEAEEDQDYLLQKVLLERFSICRHGEETEPANVIERAVDLHALTVIGSSGYQKAVKYLWHGWIVQDDKDAGHFIEYSKRDKVDYWTHFDADRMRTPMYQNGVQIFMSILYLALYTQCVNTVNEDGDLDWVEGLVYIITLGYIADEVSKFWKVGRLYFGFWNAFNSTLYALLTTSFVIRVAALTHSDDGHNARRSELNKLGYHFFAFSAPMFWMRLLLYFDMFRFFGAMIVVLKVMMRESLIFFALLIVVCVGFLQAFIGLNQAEGRESISSFIFQAMTKAVLTSPEFEGFEDYAHPFGLILYYIFSFIIMVILLNILIALFNSAYEDITDNAIDEYMALFAQKTMRFVRAPDENVFIAPLNLIEIVFLILPFEWWLPGHQYERLNHYAMTVIYSPLLLFTALYETYEAKRVRFNRKRGEEDDDTIEEWEEMEGEVDFEADGWKKTVEHTKPNVEVDRDVLEVMKLRDEIRELQDIVKRLSNVEPGDRMQRDNSAGMFLDWGSDDRASDVQALQKNDEQRLLLQMVMSGDYEIFMFKVAWRWKKFLSARYTLVAGCVAGSHVLPHDWYGCALCRVEQLEAVRPTQPNGGCSTRQQMVMKHPLVDKMKLESGYWDRANINALATPHQLCPPCKQFCSTSNLLSALPRAYADWEQSLNDSKPIATRPKNEESYQIHDYPSLQRCVSEGECHLCAIIWSELSCEAGFKPLDRLQSCQGDGAILTGILKGGGERLINHCLLTFEIGNEKCNTDIVLLVSAERDTALIEAEFDAQLALSTESDATIALAGKWLRECLSLHTTCGNERQSAVWERMLPKRLVFTGDLTSSSPPPRIVDTASLPSDTPYLTLSHMWGDAAFLHLLSTNISELCSSIPIDSLSRTHKDALRITHRLGYSYIWIDSLCIIQDSASDWKTQSALMASIYGNSTCTIAASNRSISGSGCFTRRDPLTQRPCRMTPDGVYAHPYHTANWSSFSQHYYSSKPLLSRAWVQQERILSPRILYFDSEIHWECCSLQASEAWPIGPPNDEHGFDEVYPLKAAFEAQLKPHSTWDIDDYHEFVYELWHNGVFRDYTAAQFTFEKDRLVALAGIVATIQQRTGMTCLAGLWKELLPMELMWRNMDAPSAGQKRLEDMPWQAPSWSWANVAGRKRHDLFALLNPREEIEYLSKVAECHLYPLQDMQADVVLGEISGGLITLTGFLVPAEGLSKASATSRGPGGMIVFLDVDIDPDAEHWYFCIMQSNDNETTKTNKGLILAKAEAEQQRDAAAVQTLQKYERVGVFVGSYNIETGCIFDRMDEIQVSIC